MDNPYPRWQVKLYGGVLVLFFLACFRSCEEIRYRIGGKTATAQVTQISQRIDRGQFVGFDVSYKFLNENVHKYLTGVHPIPIDALGKFSEGQDLQIEYIGDDSTFSTRLKGETHMFWVWTLLGSVAVVIVGGTVLTLRANKR